MKTILIWLGIAVKKKIDFAPKFYRWEICKIIKMRLLCFLGEGGRDQGGMRIRFNHWERACIFVSDEPGNSHAAEGENWPRWVLLGDNVMISLRITTLFCVPWRHEMEKGLGLQGLGGGRTPLR